MLDIYKKVTNYPGDMAFAHERGHFPGCSVKLFPFPPSNGPPNTLGVDVAVNEWAKANPMFIVIEILVTLSGILVVYTKQVSPEEEADLNEVAREVDALMQARRAKRAEDAAKSQEASQQAEKERERLVELGKRCEKNHKLTEAEKVERKAAKLAKPEKG